MDHISNFMSKLYEEIYKMLRIGKIPVLKVEPRDYAITGYQAQRKV